MKTTIDHTEVQTNRTKQADSPRREWPDSIDDITLPEIEKDAHHRATPYSSEEVQEIAERDGFKPESKVEWYHPKTGEPVVSAARFQGVDGTFVSDGTTTVHVSTDFQRTIGTIYDSADRQRMGVDTTILKDAVQDSKRYEKQQELTRVAERIR